jgi:superfamily II DNA or RNA helicase
MVLLRLRDYQREALEAWVRSGCYGAVVLPTGTGKTYIALEAVRRELELGGNACIIVPTIALALQWHSRVDGALGVVPSLFYGEEKGLSKVTIIVVNSAHRYRDVLPLFSLVVVDEAHHLSAPRWREVLEAARGKVLGLTATPERCPLPIVYRMTVGEARERGAVVGVSIRPVFVPLTAEERGKYLDLQDRIMRLLNELEVARRLRDRAREVECEEALKVLFNKRKQLVSLASRKFEALVDVVSKHRGEKVLVFTESVESAERARRALAKAGVRAMTYHSEMPKRTREAVLGLWGRVFDVLVAVRCLDEGIDVPECGVGVIVASGKTTRQLVQRLGRVLRPHPGKERAAMYVIVAQGTYEHDVLAKLIQIAS